MSSSPKCHNMFVKKRNDDLEEVSFDKILNRIKKLGHMDEEKPLEINYTELAIKVIDQLYDGIGTSQIDELTAEQCASLTTQHPDFGTLAIRVLISNHHKNTSESFSTVMDVVYNFRDIHDKHCPMISEDVYLIIKNNAETLDSWINHERDYDFDYFGFKTLERAYLMKINGRIVERPQYMWMRVAIGIHKSNLERVKETYDLMSQRFFTHATPTLFNAGTPRPQMSSCYLLAMEDDSIKGIYNTLGECASISKWAGGIGLHIHNIRATGSHIRGTNGTSNGIVPMLRVFNNTARYVDQCVTPDTIIYTTQGPKRMCDVVVGETQIFNKEGGYEVVENVLEHSYSGNVYNIKTMHSLFDLKITEEHPVLAIQNQKRNINYNVVRNRLDKGLVIIEWVDVKDINTDTMIGYRIPTYSKDISTITQDDCYFYGLLLGDGHLVENKTYGHITMNADTKAKQLAFIRNYLDSKYIPYSETESDSIKRNTYRIRWNKSVEMPIKYSDVYTCGKDKHIQYRWLNLPIEKSKYIIKGLIDSDGTKHNELMFDNTSLELIEGIRYLLLKMGVLTSGYIRDRVGETHVSKYGSEITNKKISYCLRIPKTPDVCELCDIQNGNNFYKFFRYHDFLFTRVKDIRKEQYDGTLYDLQMKDEHNYMIHNGIIHNGGGRRNGSFAMYLEPWHGDIQEFLEMRKNHGDEEMKARDLFYALWVPDLFMKRVKEGGNWTLMCPDKCPGLSDVYGEEFEALYEKYEREGRGIKTLEARKLWFQILDSQIETGTPYMLYKDAANKKSNQKNLGTIKSSNLCVAPETKIMTSTGYAEIQTLVDKKVDVWNGEEFSEVVVKKTGENQELLRVEFDNGSSLECTPYHKFYIQNSYNKKHIQEKSAKELVNGDCLIKCEYPVIDGKDDMLSPYTHGFFCGDGTYGNTGLETSLCKFKALDGKAYCKRHEVYQKEDETSVNCSAMSYEKRPIVKLYKEKKKLLKYLDYTSHGSVIDDNLSLILNPNIKEKFFVPLGYSLDTKLAWFAGLCDADGCVTLNQTNKSIQVTSIHKEFLENVKLLLQECGAFSTIKLMKEKGNSLLPKNDGTGEYRYYDTQALFRLVLNSSNLYKLQEIGFKCNRLDIIQTIPQRDATRFVKVTNVVITNRISDTYCFTEPKRHMGLFNGVITGQCTEILEYSDANETAVCNLASIGLSKFVEKPDVSEYKDVTVYGRTDCIYCKMAKKLLENNGVEYTYINLDDDVERKTFYEKVTFEEGLETPINTVPQVYMNDKRVGGYMELSNIVRPVFNYEKLHEVTKVVTRNLNRVIDLNFYPTEKTRLSNMRHRPIGLGVQGLADVFCLMNLPFGCNKSKEVNKNIFETIYHAALETSMEESKRRNVKMNVLSDFYKSNAFNFINENPSTREYAINESRFTYDEEDAILSDMLQTTQPTIDELSKLTKEHKGAYSSFEGSPASQGILQFDLWDVEPSNRYDWEQLRKDIIQYGLRNSLLLAPMPTASTSQILGNNECFEPFTSNIYLRRTIAGEFVVINKYLLRELIDLDMWDNEVKNNIIVNKGSAQYIENLPKCLKDKYKIVWEIPMRDVIDMAADRGPFICQSQSMNLWMENPQYDKLTSMHFYAWSKGLKTGMYYLRTKAKAAAQQFTIDPSKNKKVVQNDDDDGCLMCSG